MTLIPQSLLLALKDVPGFNEEAFKQVHASGEQVTSIRINPSKTVKEDRSGSVEKPVHPIPFALHEQVPWCATGYYLDQRPSFTFDPLFHAGCYYVQEASSMFLEQALSQLVDLSQPLKVLDLCAAPGGKSTHIQSLISADSLLVSNEVIRSRAAVLIDNISKWGCHNVVVTNNDPSHFQRLPDFFDVLVVDAPCSGSGLFRKDIAAIEEWSPGNVVLCCQRQQRILADVLPTLKEGGILVYSTCSYSKEEDEEIADWLVEALGMKNEKLSVEAGWNIVENRSEKARSYGYRFFPDKVKGEGFYIACFKKMSGTNTIKHKTSKWEQPTAGETSIALSWINDSDTALIKLFNKIAALPKLFKHELSVLKASLNIQYAGVLLGEVYHHKFVPAHALALSSLLSEDIPGVVLSYEQAISYLQRGELTVNTVTKGWQVVRFQRHNLGWINALSNRINNYYPKELRILKQQNDISFKK